MNQLLLDSIDPKYDSFPQTNLSGKTIIYWMLRENRVEHNRGLFLAQQLAQKNNLQLHIVSAFRKDLSKHTMLERTFTFILDGLKEVEQSALKKNIPYTFLHGDPQKTLPEYAKKHQAAAIITDLFPLPIYNQWYEKIQHISGIPFIVVDGRNSVPIWKVSEKQEYAARTIRPKLWKHFDDYRESTLQIHSQEKHTKNKNNWEKIQKDTKTTHCSTDIGTIPLESGYRAAQRHLKNFVKKTLPHYAEKRNDPTQNATSKLSAYIHFGQISVEEIIESVRESSAKQENKDAFLEECIIRRELAENFTYYTKNPTSLKSVPTWAQETLAEHADDRREYQYSYKEFLQAQTHDPAWNAAQRQLVQTGYMHGYMRMYWAKKILEWTPSPKKALDIILKLNDLLELDGRSPNGYVGALWAIGGLHDRPWKERPIFGKIRYMNANGLQRKFDVDAYVAHTKNLKST